MTISVQALEQMYRHHVARSLAEGSEPVGFSEYAARFCRFFGYSIQGFPLAPLPLRG